MYPKEFCHAQQFIGKVTSFDPFSGHHQICISEPTNVPGHFRAIVRTVYENPRMFWAIFGPSWGLCIRTHKRKFRPIFGLSLDLNIKTHERNFRPIFGPSSDLYTRTHERKWNGPKIVSFVINCVNCNGTTLDTFSDLSTRETCHLKVEILFANKTLTWSSEVSYYLSD